MKEDFIHYVWNFKLFDMKDLITTQREQLKILKVGHHNPNSGPDFFNARIKIDRTSWAGNVEVHIKSSDWENHNHHKDQAYDNIILHVVYKADKDIRRVDGTVIPTLELKEKIDQQLYDRYVKLIESPTWIPCESQLAKVDDFVIRNWIDRMLFERMEDKIKVIFRDLTLNKNDWEETFYHHIAKGFGIKVNSAPFELLSKTIKQKILVKHKNDLLQMEALLFGQAGLLNTKQKDDYIDKLQHEYHFLQKKYNLSPIKGYSWKFSRLRPVSFPHVRISQFARLIFQSTGLFSMVMEAESYSQMMEMFSVSASQYWDTHYRFGKMSKDTIKTMGSFAIQMLIINTIVPFLFAYGKARGKEMLQDRGVTILHTIPREDNRIIRKWVLAGVKVNSAYDSQALIQMIDGYCAKKKCLECSIGYKILR